MVERPLHELLPSKISDGQTFLFVNDGPKENTDRHLWRKSEDHFAPSIHVTRIGAIGINVGGRVYVMSVERWHALAILDRAVREMKEFNDL